MTWKQCFFLLWRGISPVNVGERQTPEHYTCPANTFSSYRAKEHSLRALYDLFCWHELARARSFKKDKVGACTAIIFFWSITNCASVIFSLNKQTFSCQWKTSVFQCTSWKYPAFLWLFVWIETENPTKCNACTVNQKNYDLLEFLRFCTILVQNTCNSPTNRTWNLTEDMFRKR